MEWNINVKLLQATKRAGMTVTWRSSQRLMEERWRPRLWGMLGDATIRMFRHPNSVHDTVICVHSATNVMLLHVFGSTIRWICTILSRVLTKRQWIAGY